MRGAIYASRIVHPYGMVAVLCLLPWGVSRAAQASAQSSSQQADQQRRAQAARDALESSERRIAAAQAEEIRQAQERSEQQRRAMAEADRRREAEERREEQRREEQRREESLAQARAQARQSNPPQPQAVLESPQATPPETADVPPPASTLEPLPSHYLLMRYGGLVLMIGASIGALFVLGRIVRERLGRY